MYKKVLLITSILIIGGCAEKGITLSDFTQEIANADFTKGVSEKDKKLLSSYHDEILSNYRGIRITKNGFYPNCIIGKPRIGRGANECSYYMTSITNDSPIKKFDLKRFMNDVNTNNLKKIRMNLLLINKKYPSINTNTLNFKNINLLSAKNTPLNEKQKILVRSNPSYFKKIINPSETLQEIIIKAHPEYAQWIKNPSKKILDYAARECVSYSYYTHDMYSTNNYHWNNDKRTCRR